MAEDTMETSRADLGQTRQGEHRSVLSLRKSEDGLRIVGEAPPVHLLASSFVEREVMDGNVEVVVTLKTVDGPVYYRLVGYELDDRGQPNRSSWIMERVD